ncbi:MAG: Hemolysin secretion protein D, chromosomal [Syntrophorhabdaceae bacterium PtaU1.Bin034]|nr:MAG: Hemolysin secretion protein D, chromosomal [Syntrophorhabdaceae bacterium PtaU1.Bin034]
MKIRWLTRDDTHEFKPTIAEIEERPAHPLGKIIFWLVVGTMLFFTLWLCIGKIDVVVSARGTVIPEGDVKILQPLDTGVVSAILCKEGDFVRKGQVLMEIDPSITAPELESKKKSLEFLELEQRRLDLTLTGKPFSAQGTHDKEAVRRQRELHASMTGSLEKQLASKKAELCKVEEEMRAAEKEREAARAQLDIDISKEQRLKEVLDIIARSDYEKVVQDILARRNAIEQASSRIDQLRHQQNQIQQDLGVIEGNFKVTNLKEFTDKQKQSTEIRAEIDKTSFKNEKQRILSPVDGHISTLLFHTIGGVVTPAQKLMTVVPLTAPLVIKATVLNKDIGFIKERMPVSLKIDTFDFQKYGILKGVTRNIARHSIEDEKLGPVYEVFVTPLDTQVMVEGVKTSITSGMSLTAEIKVGKRRIIEFFIYPLIKYLDEGVKVR